MTLVTKLNYDEAGKLLKRARWNVKAAIVMDIAGVDYKKAVAQLKNSNQVVRLALANA